MPHSIPLPELLTLSPPDHKVFLGWIDTLDDHFAVDHTAPAATETVKFRVAQAGTSEVAAEWMRNYRQNPAHPLNSGHAAFLAAAVGNAAFTWDNCKAAMEAEFFGHTYMDRLYNRWYAMKQGQKKISEYTLELRSVHAQLTRDRPPDAQAKEKLRISVNPDINLNTIGRITAVTTFAQMIDIYNEVGTQLEEG